MLFKLLLTCLLLNLAGSTPHHHELDTSTESSSETGHSSESAESSEHAPNPKHGAEPHSKCHKTNGPSSHSENHHKLGQDEVVKNKNEVPKEKKDVPKVAAGSEVNKVGNPSTVTPAGVINGSWMETRKGRRFQAYRGIRYAEPPVGMLRFEVSHFTLFSGLEYNELLIPLEGIV